VKGGAQLFQIICNQKLSTKTQGKAHLVWGHSAKSNDGWENKMFSILAYDKMG